MPRASANPQPRPRDTRENWTKRLKLNVPYINSFRAAGDPEGGGGDYGSDSGGYDQLGFGTLMYAK